MYGEYKLKRPLSPGQEQLRQRMTAEAADKKYKAVSFKLMGTLVLLPFDECGIFSLMESEFTSSKRDRTFTELREEAQEAAVKKKGVLHRVSVGNIYDILAKLSGIDSKEKERLMKLECSLFVKYAFPRECAKAVFRTAKNAKKRVIITAETIYPPDTVKEVLEKCGYGSYDELIFTGDIPDCTGESYFKAVLEKAGVSADRLLHIGGDVAFDVELPIIKGAKALLLTPPEMLMARSGRVRGYAEEKKLFEYDKPEYLMLRCVFGLYSAYGFDVPQNKLPLSDFCGDLYMMGFLVLGALSLTEEKNLTGMKAKIAAALEELPGSAQGRDDFIEMFRAHFGEDLRGFSAKGCDLPLEFAEKCCASSDRAMIESCFDAGEMKKWASSVKEPEIVPFSAGDAKKNALSKLADKMFPPGTKVRTITDGILSKMHK